MPNRSRADIVKGSKSFSLASFFFGEAARQGSWQLYSWCRYCDDQIDNAITADDARRNLEQLREKTRACFGSESQDEHPWSAFQTLVHQYRIPSKYALDLIRGMEWDASGRPIENQRELIDYCYCVAGTVGLMMCHVMGISSERALKNAVDLGIAMQLTNIARDFREDWQRGRCYLPKEWLSISPAELLHLHNRMDLKALSNRLLNLADSYYESGLQGLPALSWRAAWAVLIAAHVYRDIGHQVRQGGLEVFDSRVVVSRGRKIWLVLKASTQMIKWAWNRRQSPWQPVPIQNVWSPE
jgi:phytoene synthase